MTALTLALREAVIEGGALAAAVYDRSTYNIIAGHAHRCTECNPDPPTTPERGVTMQAPVFVADRKAEGR